ncbi:MAG: hypothetical protein HKL92_02445 [Candidatus Eremiobacteraeota bacterium]|nr:hypothetical protein [Candidatus Eremiobacteraeota bacterium]NNM92177.1 hypothetical protein [Candidatus Eremiobacteraeota bacterium]
MHFSARRVICAILLSALCGVFAPPTRLPAAAGRWIANNCVAPDGAITVRPGGRRVSGYFGNLTALGLAHAGREPGVVLGWLRWYIAHARKSPNDVPDDATLGSGGHVASTHQPDSTDAYAATFLMLAWAAYRGGTPVLRAFVIQHRSAIERIALSTVATQQRDGLTWARPSHHVAYAIDNAQVYRGLLDGASMAGAAYHDFTFSRLLLRDAKRVKRGMLQFLWNPQLQTFRPFIGARSAVLYPNADMHVPYPDALAQATAVLYGILSPKGARATALLQRARPALARPSPGANALEFKFIYIAARKQIGRRVRPIRFSPPPLCSEAGWELLLYR